VETEVLVPHYTGREVFQFEWAKNFLDEFRVFILDTYKAELGKGVFKGFIGTPLDDYTDVWCDETSGCESVPVV